ncbi:hypothetical protein XENOCAPTIV_015333 [Xenoophorus captivus]|uniref:FZ domain-containing protein n=1 Tax=Xenoophorus captivus TaxID=1517983 RepID=A0ABV0QVS7_9TELE
MPVRAEYLLLSVIHGLLNGECSPEIRLVGCSVLASPCRDNKMVKPCRSTCEALRKGCIHAFEAIEMAWPYFLDCDRFFAGNEEGCFDPLAGLKGKDQSLVLFGPIKFETSLLLHISIIHSFSQTGGGIVQSLS